VPVVYLCHRPGSSDRQAFAIQQRLQADLSVSCRPSGPVADSDVFLLLIDPGWLSASTPDGQRCLDDLHDPVRLALREALGASLRVLPLLLDGAPMPRSADLPQDVQMLVRRHAMSLRSEQLGSDLAPVIATLQRLLEPGFGTLLAPTVAASASAAVTPAPAPPADPPPPLNDPPPLTAQHSLPPLPPVHPAPAVPRTAPLPPPERGQRYRHRSSRERRAEKRRIWALRLLMGVGGLVAAGLVVGLTWMVLKLVLQPERDSKHSASGAVAATPSAVPVPASEIQAASAPNAALTVGQIFRDCSAPVCPSMVVLPGGSFVMGSDADGRGSYEDERPAHAVTVRSFAVGRFELTFQEWDACFQDKECPHWPADEGWGRERRPVINISWEDAQHYVKWLSQRTGQRYRLLSEAEWEYAARAGTTTPYSFGDEIRRLGDYAWMNSNSGNQSHPVGEKKPNPFGLFDMHGGVWEWVQDCWHRDYQGSPPLDGSAWDSDCRVSRHVVRGGSWGDTYRQVRSSYRYGYSAEGRSIYQGLRVARDIRPVEAAVPASGAAASAP
jgi:formylglycine-generating enzyme required for sulfatase activity